MITFKIQLCYQTKDDNFNLIPAEATRLGKANDDLDHWRFEVTPFDARENFVAMKPDPLDGNGQLFLCLQDLTIPNGQFQVLMDTKLKQVGGRFSVHHLRAVHKFLNHNLSCLGIKWRITKIN